MRRLSLMQQLRFALAPSAARREALRLGAYLAGLLVVLAITGTMDYQDELRADAMRAEARFADQQAAMLACLNGGSPGLYRMTQEGHRAYLVCEIYEVTDQNVKGKRS
jgi:hypothetical protein